MCLSSCMSVFAVLLVYLSLKEMALFFHRKWGDSELSVYSVLVQKLSLLATISASSVLHVHISIFYIERPYTVYSLYVCVGALWSRKSVKPRSRETWSMQNFYGHCNFHNMTVHFGVLLKKHNFAYEKEICELVFPALSFACVWLDVNRIKSVVWASLKGVLESVRLPESV